MTHEDLARYVGADGEQLTFVSQCWAEAVAMVSQYVGTRPVPQVMLDRACVETGAELYNRRGARFGFIGMDEGTGGVFASKDPMSRVYALLQPWGPY